jgi:hypothetical protein
MTAPASRKRLTRDGSCVGVDLDNRIKPGAGFVDFGDSIDVPVDEYCGRNIAALHLVMELGNTCFGEITIVARTGCENQQRAAQHNGRQFLHCSPLSMNAHINAAFDPQIKGPAALAAGPESLFFKRGNCESGNRRQMLSYRYWILIFFFYFIILLASKSCSVPVKIPFAQLHFAWAYR